VCGPIGAAVVAARLLGLSEAERDNALAAAVLRAGGARAAFGSDGKAIQVGQAAAAGVQAGLLARAGAQVDPAVIFGELGFVGVFGAGWPVGGMAGVGGTGDAAPAIERNWIKLHPSCLGTHSPIECAVVALEGGFALARGGVEVVVHPVGRQAAHRDLVHDGLAAKFSIPYCVGFTLLHGRPPRVGDFAGVDEEVCAAAPSVSVVVDASLPEFGAVLRSGGRELARVPYPKGGPENPASADDLAAKVADLAGGRLDGVLARWEAPAADVLEALAT
jgi:2-methylcitrate dehydratase PrpD